MKKAWIGILVACSVIATQAILAKEPENLHLAKERVVKYHDSGEYQKDINHVIDQAMVYLKKRIADKKPDSKKMAIILDIDETSLSNYADMSREDFGGTKDEIRDAEDRGNDPAIDATLKLYQYAKANGVAVFFVTGRHEEEREATANNLKKSGFDNWDGLVLRDGEFKKAPAATYKTAIRKKITSEGYDIIINIGDQKSDLAGGYSDKTYKLPNPYYFIP